MQRASNPGSSTTKRFQNRDLPTLIQSSPIKPKSSAAKNGKKLSDPFTTQNKTATHPLRSSLSRAESEEQSSDNNDDRLDFGENQNDEYSMAVQGLYDRVRALVSPRHFERFVDGISYF